MGPVNTHLAVLGVGVDLCSVPRLGAALERTPGLWHRLFTPSEAEALAGFRSDGADEVVHARAALMFAVKEATMKSLGAGFDVVPFAAIEVDLEAPAVGLHGAGAARAAEVGVSRFEVEHERIRGPRGEVAVAEVLAYGVADR